MALSTPAGVHIVVGGIDVTGDVYTGSFDEENLIEETHAFGDSWEENTPVGIAKFTLTTGEGLYDDRTYGQLLAFRDRPFTRQTVALMVGGDDIGSEVLMLDGTYVVKFSRGPKKDGLTTAMAEHAIHGQREFGSVIHGLDSETAATGDTESTPYDAALPYPPADILTSEPATDSVETRLPHGLMAGDFVFIEGHTGSTPAIDSTLGSVGVEVLTIISDTEFEIAIDITVGGTGGTFRKFRGFEILTSDTSDVITTAGPHGFKPGDEVFIAGHSGSVPDINNAVYTSTPVLTVPTATTFTIAGPITTGGTGGRAGVVVLADAAADLHVPAITLGGYTDVTVLLRDSADESTYATRFTFVNVDQAGSFERAAATGLRRYRAMSWTFNGAGAGQSVTPFVAAQKY